ncbi:hypothetical protein BDQ17DRAFT_1328613 [Cyathus striatus]|nr:hypothetical protein BDQ17DRAFT_1328613 [Cyathus striatus]
MWVEKAMGCLTMLKGMAMEPTQGKRDEGGGGLEDVDNEEEGHVLDDVASRLLLSELWPSCKGPSTTLRSHYIVAVVVTHRKRRRRRRDGCLMMWHQGCCCQSHGHRVDPREERGGSMVRAIAKVVKEVAENAHIRRLGRNPTSFPSLSQAIESTNTTQTYNGSLRLNEPVRSSVMVVQWWGWREWTIPLDEYVQA